MCVRGPDFFHFWLFFVNLYSEAKSLINCLAGYAPLIFFFCAIFLIARQTTAHLVAFLRVLYRGCWSKRAETWFLWHIFAIFNDFSWFSKKKNVHNSTPRALKISSLAPLESAWKELSNGDKLELRSCCGVEIWRKDFLKIARFFAIFRDFLRGKPLGQLHHGHVRYRA